MRFDVVYEHGKISGSPELAPQVSEAFPRVFVNIFHHENLRISFFDTLLIDANLVYPHDSSFESAKAP